MSSADTMFASDWPKQELGTERNTGQSGRMLHIIKQWAWTQERVKNKATDAIHLPRSSLTPPPGPSLSCDFLPIQILHLSLSLRLSLCDLDSISDHSSLLDHPRP